MTTPDTAAIRDKWPMPMFPGIKRVYARDVHTLCDEVDRLREERRWRKVEEELPDPRWLCLVTNGTDVDVAYWEPRHQPPEWSRPGCESPLEGRKVIAWAPLPDLPEGA